MAVAGLAIAQAQFSKAQGLREAFLRREKVLKAGILSLEAEEEVLEIVCQLFRKLIDTEVSDSVNAVEKLQIEGLQRVFTDQDISVRSTVEVQRGKVSVALTTIQKQANGLVIEGVSNEAFGGSVVTVQSVILRITVMFRRGMRPVMFLDESLPAFDDTYVYNMGSFLRNLCDRLGIDLLMVTHLSALADSANRAYRLTNKSGEATLRLLTAHPR